MFRVMYNDGTVQEVPGAVSAAVHGEYLVCFGRDRDVVASFPKADVVAYGSNEALDPQVIAGVRRIRIMQKDGTIKEIPDAMYVAVLGDNVVCFNFEWD